MQKEDRLKGVDSDAFGETVMKRLKNPKRRKTQTEESRRHFWNLLDHRSGILLELTKRAGNPDDPLGNNSFGESSDEWTIAVRNAATAAYEAVCPHATPRQLQAYAAGLKQLRPKTPKSKSSAASIP